MRGPEGLAAEQAKKAEMTISVLAPMESGKTNGGAPSCG